MESLEDRTLATAGFPSLPNLKSISPTITVSRISGNAPFVVQVDGNATSAVGSTHPFDELEYDWDFGGANEHRTVMNPVTHKLVDASSAQTGPEASFVYSTPGTYTITLTVKGFTGTSYVTAKTTKSVTVQPWTGQDMYFDPVSGKDTNPGTQAAPKQSWEAVKVFLTANENVLGSSDRRAFLKRGTVFNASSSIRLRYDDHNLVIGTYGTGAAPVVKATTSLADLISLETDYGRNLNDFCVSGLNFDGQGLVGNVILGYRAHNNEASGLPYGSSSNVYFVDCGFKGATSTQVNVSMTTTGLGGSATNWGFWNPTIDSGSSPGQGLYFGLDNHGFVLGGSFVGGRGDLILDHDLYLNVWGTAFVRWTDFGSAQSRNFAINANCRTDGVNVNYILIDACNVTGTQNGIDLSNAHNVPSLGAFDNVIIQGSAIHDTGAMGTQSIGVLGESLRRVTIRDSSFYGNGMLASRTGYNGVATDFLTRDPSTYAAIYRNNFWKPDLSRSSSIIVGGTAGGYVAYNKFVTLAHPDRTNPAIIRYDASHLAGWTVDFNTFYSPNLLVAGVPIPFAELTTGNRLNFKTWAALGFDKKGSYQNPGWKNPALGIF